MKVTRWKDELERDDAKCIKRTRTYAASLDSGRAVLPHGWRLVSSMAEVRAWYDAGGREMWIVEVDIKTGAWVSLSRRRAKRWGDQRGGMIVDTTGFECGAGEYINHDWPDRVRHRTIVGVWDPPGWAEPCEALDVEALLA